MVAGSSLARGSALAAGRGHAVGKGQRYHRRQKKGESSEVHEIGEFPLLRHEDIIGQILPIT